MLPVRTHRLGLLPLFLCGVSLAFLSPVFWLTTRLPEAAQARSYENLPLYERVYPSVSYTFERLRAGEWPLWNPWQLCGAEHLADPRNGVFEPLKFIFLWLPPELGLAAHGLLCSFLMGLSFLLFVRSLGMRHVPSLFGAMAYAFSGAGAAAIAFPGYAAFMVYLPLMFWAARNLVRGDAGASVVLGVSLALGFLSGAVDALLATGVILVAYMAAGLFVAGKTSGAGRAVILRRFRGALLIALGLSAAQLLPYFAWAWEHGAFWPFGASELQAALPNGMRELLQQLLRVPQDGLLPPLAYFGALSLIVLPTALFHRQARVDVIFFLLTAAVGLLLAVFGRMGWDARVPFEALIFPASFAVAVVVAVGADRLFETGRDPRSPNVWGPVLIVLVGALFLVYLMPSFGRGVALVFLAVALVPSVVVRLRWTAAVCCGLGVSILFVDLCDAMRQRVLHPYANMPAALAVHDPEYRAAQEQAISGRVLLSTRPLDGAVVQNLGALRELRCAGGLFPALTKAQRAWWDRLRDAQPGNRASADAIVSPNAAQPSLLNFMAVRALLVTSDAPLSTRKWGDAGPRLRPALSGGSLGLMVNDDALPRAYWVSGWRAAESLEAAITQLGAPEFRPGHECVVEATGRDLETLVKTVPAGAAQVSTGAEPLACAIVADTPERVELRVNAPAAGLTILADTFAPGWRAEIDGGHAGILRVNGLFRGVITPAGNHTIVFTYRPWFFGVGLGTSLLSGVILVLWAVWRLFSRSGVASP